jgi:ADP-ribose pyrophosphatase
MKTVKIYQLHHLSQAQFQRLREAQADFYVSPGGSSERIMLYYAEVGANERVDAGGGRAAEHEDIEQVELTLPELQNALAQSEVRDAKTLIAVQWLLLQTGQPES